MLRIASNMLFLFDQTIAHASNSFDERELLLNSVLVQRRQQECDALLLQQQHDQEALLVLERDIELTKQLLQEHQQQLQPQQRPCLLQASDAVDLLRRHGERHDLYRQLSANLVISGTTQDTDFGTL